MKTRAQAIKCIKKIYTKKEFLTILDIVIEMGFEEKEALQLIYQANEELQN